MAYPAGAVRLTAANDTWTPAFLHKDHLGSVRAISGPSGTPEERTLYRPYGAQSEVVTATLNDDKSWLGERYDAGAGLQYLNARYYDPELAMFLQPDWFEVMQPGVGTNRYSYSFGDPVNKMDPAGNVTTEDALEMAEDIYDQDEEDDKEDDLPDHVERVTDERLAEMGIDPETMEDKKNGLKAGLYYNKKTGEYTLAFAGTDGGTDWKNNVAQILGASPQYRAGIALARQVSRAVNKAGGDLSFTGHSLGGGIATVSALAVRNAAHKEAVVFNSAGVSTLTRLTSSRNVFAPHDIRNFNVLGDPVSASSYNAFMPSQVGTKTFLRMPPGQAYSPRNLHGIGAVRSALQFEGYIK